MPKTNIARSVKDKEARLRELELRCLRYLERARWSGGLRCVRCSGDKITRLKPDNESAKPRIRYQCHSPRCRRQFSPTTGTIFERTHLPLFKWFYLLFLSKNKKTGLRLSEISYRLRIPYKTAHEMKRTLAVANPLLIERLAYPSHYVTRAIVESPTIRNENFRPKPEYNMPHIFEPVWEFFTA